MLHNELSRLKKYDECKARVSFQIQQVVAVRQAATSHGVVPEKDNEVSLKNWRGRIKPLTLRRFESYQHLPSSKMAIRPKYYGM